ncbi:hypothetical protein IEQ34_014216 [Dendrobium chrysotoxum]|uniref:Uncharacterized protein n=1 Tax=Dendrobium chrysotoxum TaxID=161865 RepID=A0AAV7GKS4_DENCH|nr:hypothetical protein IEQ34_014216 [Dendrobium chrysotoxum]
MVRILAARASSFWNSRSPWRNSESMSLTATCWPEGSVPRYTGPKPPWPSLWEGEKEDVARRSREKEKRRRGLGGGLRSEGTVATARPRDNRR